MSDLIVIVYPNTATAEEVRKRLFKLQGDYLVELQDAVIATKADDGSIKLNQIINTTALGAVSGSFWGLLVGVLFMNPLLGVAVGAASGALGGALTDYGINDPMMKDLSASMQPGSAALFVLASKLTADKVIDQIKEFGGVVLKTSLDRSKEQALRDALGMAAGSATATSPAGSVAVLGM